MIEIIPAILPKTFAELQKKMSLIVGLSPMIQIDVTDGRFVPSKTWPYTSGGVVAGKNSDQDFSDIFNEQKDFPFLNEIDFEVDLMVVDPENVWRDWVHVGAKRIIIHLESTKYLESPKETLEFIKNIQKELPPRESVLHVEVGIAINPDTANEHLDSLIEEVDFVQFMGIAKIGFQGQPFDDRVIEKIADLRGRFPNVTISVDGSVNLETAPKLAKAGVNRLVIGSAIFGGGAEDEAEAPEDVANAFDEICSAVDC